MSHEFDIIVISDLRFPGGNSTAVAAELAALVRGGYRTGLFHIRGPILNYPHPVHPEIRAYIDRGDVPLLDPRAAVSTRAVIAHHPSVFSKPIDRPLAISADVRLLIVEHPPLDGELQPQYNVDAVNSYCSEALNGDIIWAPMSPVVRDQFHSIGRKVGLHPEDWYSVIDVDRWAFRRAGTLGERPVIGRHSRPHILKWPERTAELLQAYPIDPRVDVRVLGAPPNLSELVGTTPRGWRILPFNSVSPIEFLRSIDFFVYFHHSKWIEAFGRAILEAMAAGAVCILPRYFSSLFGDAALYCEPRDVFGIVLNLTSNQSEFSRMSSNAIERAQERFSLGRHVERIRALIGEPRCASRTSVVNSVSSKPSQRATRRAGGLIFISSNGVGMGHLTRQLAIARRCKVDSAPVFVSMSQAVGVVGDFGYRSEYIPFHGYLGAEPKNWNLELQLDLDELLQYYDPRVVVFDGNIVYGGLVEAIKRNRQRTFVWCRRAMWPQNKGSRHIVPESNFDAVIEPGELAAEYDFGITREYRSRTRQVSPITLLAPDELLTRDAACDALGLRRDREHVLVQLGSGNNYDFHNFAAIALEQLSKMGLNAVVARWLMSNQEVAPTSGVQTIEVFPIGKYLKAFEFVVSASGYNSFHELVRFCVPSIFVPNENPQMDNQLARALFADRQGVGVCVRRNEIYRLEDAFGRMRNREFVDRLRHRCVQLIGDGDGAREAAVIIEELYYAAQCDRLFSV